MNARGRTTILSYLKIIRNFTKVNLKQNKRNKNFDLPLIKCIFKLNLIHIILII